MKISDQTTSGSATLTSGSLSTVTTQQHSSDLVLRQLDSSLTALVIYMNELNQQTGCFNRLPKDRSHVQNVTVNATKQVNLALAFARQLSDHNFGRGVSCTCESIRKTVGFMRDTSRSVNSSSKATAALTLREKESLALIIEGYSNKEAAIHMGISRRTFESYRANLLRKLMARNTADLVRKSLALNDGATESVAHG